MTFEVQADGTILLNGQPIAKTNNPDAVRRKLARR